MAFQTETYLVRGNQIILLATAFITALVGVIEMVATGLTSGIFYWNNLGATVLTLIIVIAYLITRKNLPLYYGALALTILANLAIQWFVTSGTGNFLPPFLRDSIYVALLLTMVAFITSRWFSLIFGLIYFGLLSFFSFHVGQIFLQENYLKLAIIFGAYIGVVFYFVGTLRKGMGELNDFNELAKTQNEEIQMQNAELQTQQEEIIVQRDSLEQQKTIIEKKNQDTNDNLMFAKSIQQSILPKIKDYKDYLPDSFILLYPKDAISGDFYWIQEKNGKIFIAAIDCTGHGASGALVSMIMYLTMNRVLRQLEKPTPSSILNKLDSILIAEFNKDTIDFNARIGMDLALVAIDIENMQLQYAGAINPLYLVRDGQLVQYKASRHLLGIDTTEIFNYFENTYIDIKPGDTIYLFSDGLPDQFGGPEGKKFGYKQFREFLEQVSVEEIEDQKVLISRFIDDWKGVHEQVDDILLIGIRF
ncbi:MAG: SpoIIE family protein phosphatase [Bacteroidales bacterium]